MIARLVLSTLFLTGLAAFAAAAETGSDAAAWRRLPSGLEFREAKAPLEDWPLTIALVRFDPTTHRLRVEAAQPHGARTADFEGREDVLAAVNANMTGGDGCGIGWVRADSEDLGRLRRNLGGVLIVMEDGKTEIRRALQVPLEPPPRDAVQAGDLLTLEGFANPSLNGGLSRRSFAGTDKQGRVVLGLTSGPVWPRELAKFLARKEAQGGAELVATLTFEEGSASQLFVRAAQADGESFLTRDAVPVPVSLVVEKR